MSEWPTIQRDDKSAAFFDAAARDELMIKRCAECEQPLPPEATVCTSCTSTDLNWTNAQGAGRLISWTVVHRAPNRAYAGVVPYTVGIVELAEGPWLYARIETDAPGAGLPVRARFVRPEEGECYPVFVASP